MKIKNKYGTIFYSTDVEGDIVFANDEQNSFYHLEDVFDIKKDFVLVAVGEGEKK